MVQNTMASLPPFLFKMEFLAMLRTLLGTTFALIVAVAVSLPRTASATDTQSAVDPGLKKAIDNATFYVPGLPGAVHFHNGEAVKHETLKDAHGDVLSGTIGSYIGDNPCSAACHHPA